MPRMMLSVLLIDADQFPVISRYAISHDGWVS